MTSKHDVHSRYARDNNGILCIDVATEKAEDLYDNFDRDAPYIRRDLQQDLVDYLIECASDLYPQPFVIRFSFVSRLEIEKLDRIRNSMNTFFQYLATREKRRLQKMLYRSGTCLLIGLTLLVGAVYLNERLGPEPGVVMSVLAEGLIIAAWVSLWEALATFLVDWFPRYRQIRLYRVLANAQLFFR